MRSFIVLMGLGLISLASGCGSKSDGGGDQVKAAIKRVYEADRQLSKMIEAKMPNANASRMAALIEVYADGVDRIPMSDCPVDFQVAYRQHARAWRESKEAIEALPDGKLEAVFVGFGNFVLGETDGGVARLEAGLRAARGRIQATWEEVEKVGAKYGVLPL